MAVSSTREPSRVQLAIAPASDLASVCVLTLRQRPSLSTDGRRDRLLMASCTAESSSPAPPPPPPRWSPLLSLTNSG